MDDIKRLGQFLRETRKQQKLTQEQLAAATGVGVRFIRELEQGKATCQLGKTLQVIRMLGLTIQIGGQSL